MINADRASGLGVFVLGLMLYFVVIPGQIETVNEGWMRPNSLPNVLALVLMACGLLLQLRATAHRIENPREMAMAALYFVVLALGLAAISLLGFTYAAPILAASVMLLMGERRPIWLGLGIFGTPLVIWLVVEQALGRVLP
ncbi:MAG: tripartite tricarboxylate transporter TctB family protein [Pelagimonas sp.]